MSEAAAPKTQAVAVQRERIIVSSPTPIWDSADFEQMQRVAVVLTRSGLVPASLCWEKAKDDNGKEIDALLPEAVIVARCTLVCNQARIWGADPLNVLQCTSLINGRLMYEGKLINAVVRHLVGVQLKFELGLWDTDHFEGVEGDRSKLNGVSERLAIRCFDPNDADRYVDGSVGQWKTTRANSPWSKAADWPRQLRYRAVREWARAYEPGTILGILADGDEDIDLRDVTPKASGVMARLSGSQDGDGFDPDKVSAEIGDKPKRGRKPKADAEPQGISQEPAEGADSVTATEPHDPVTGEILDGDDLPEGLRHARPIETANAPSADTPAASSGSATDASGDSAAATSSPAQPDAPSPTGEDVEVLTEGFPEVDEVYHLSGEAWGADDRRVTYKNGSVFSTAPRSKGLAIYEMHSTLGGPPEEADEPIEEGDDEGFPPEFEAYIDKIEASALFAEVKAAMAEFYKSELFKGWPLERQNKVRATTWETAKENCSDLPDHGNDVSAFRLWIEWIDDADAIKGTLAVLEKAPTFDGKEPSFKDAIRKAAASRMERLKGA